MDQLERRVALSFLAHPDDAEILCAGTLIQLADIGIVEIERLSPLREVAQHVKHAAVVGP